MEDFLDIPGFEGYYQINSNGQARSLDRVVPHPYGPKGSRIMKGKMLAQPIDSNGYVTIVLSKDGKNKHLKVHILLGRMFIPNPNNYPVVRHLNDIKTDNRLVNLAWGTYQDNAKDCLKNGNHFTRRGEDHHWHGRKTSPNKGKFGVLSPNSKIVCDLETGVFYYGCKEAAAAKSINHNTLRSKLCGVVKNNTQLVYV